MADNIVRKSNTFQDLTGKKFGRITPTQYLGKGKWECQCECGNQSIVFGANLRRGTTKSCGCWRKDYSRSAAKTHGLSKDRIYTIWLRMISRCTNPKNNRWQRYGGRGISVCQRWKDSFENFLEDMGYPPTQKHSIDRINVDGDYCPENCRWATPTQQSRNMTSNVLINFNGEIRCITEWAEISGIKEGTIRYRIHNGWSAKDALTKPVRKMTRRK